MSSSAPRLAIWSDIAGYPEGTRVTPFDAIELQVRRLFPPGP